MESRSIVPIIVSAEEDWDDLRYAGEMMHRQFYALSTRLHHSPILAEVPTLPRIVKPNLGQSADPKEIKKWLLNGWNTENLLKLTSEILDRDENASALQWTFPQAYYSAYALVMAFFTAAGFTERSHTAVIKKFGELVLVGHYPQTISFAVTGTGKNLQYHNIARPEAETALSFDSRDPESINKHICQFLAATRRISLEEKRPDFKFKTKRGQPKNRLTETDWERVAGSVGATSLLSLLYRKRIKANYRDIDTFAFSGVDSAKIHLNCLKVVTALNFIHECMIAAAVGWETFDSWASEFLRDCDLERVERRLPFVERICSGGAS